MKLPTKHTTPNYKVFIYEDEKICLYSYNTAICQIDVKNTCITLSKYYEYSSTTKRHLRWFFEDTMQWNIGVNDIRRALKDCTPINGYTVQMLS